MSAQYSPMAVAQGLVPALLLPLCVPQEEFWYPNVLYLALMSPL